MKFDVITIFPQIFESLRVSEIWKRAESAGRIEFGVHDLRAYAEDKHQTVDDVPFGGGPGMVLKIEPLVRAVETIAAVPGRKVLYASPQGRILTQFWVSELAQVPQLVVVAGRYEGVDERFVEGWVDETFSIGDYVVAGGELPAMVLLEAVARQVPGVVGSWESVATDSFTSGLLKYPQYTRPAEFRGKAVPEVLRSGNHREIERWRKAMALKRTLERRPAILAGSILETIRSPEKGKNPD
ncbi:MAG TPA: tRNA (guanosine(37)-N1)-methyltransferase TrmD [Bdellovibrionota bacterium]|nr:tRNA (guanosine(37)-N1)-methyltransferase TrmD [Bdellovibrionota bacterium]